VALKEFAPDRLILLGPGNSLGGATAQVLIRHGWWDLESKNAFSERQKRDPVLLSMGMASQRRRIVGAMTGSVNGAAAGTAAEAGPS
jgi:[acyl-carrier-protein] S-malonyltransferase